MKFARKFALLAALAMLALASPLALADEPQAGIPAQALSEYLHSHLLPLVETRMLTDSFGFRTLVLYGFVATQVGKTDAEVQSRRFLNDPQVLIDNRIKVRPELLQPGGTDNLSPALSSAGPTDDENVQVDEEAGEALGSVDAYENQQVDDPMLGAPLMPSVPMIVIGMAPIMPVAPPPWGYPSPFFFPPGGFAAESPFFYHPLLPYPYAFGHAWMPAGYHTIPGPGMSPVVAPAPIFAPTPFMARPAFGGGMGMGFHHFGGGIGFGRGFGFGGFHR